MCTCTGLLAFSAALFLLALVRSDGAVSYREVAELGGGAVGGGWGGRGGGGRPGRRGGGGRGGSRGGIGGTFAGSLLMLRRIKGSCPGLAPVDSRGSTAC